MPLSLTNFLFMKIVFHVTSCLKYWTESRHKRVWDTNKFKYEIFEATLAELLSLCYNKVIFLYLSP